MARNRAWETYRRAYRDREMKTLATWIAAGESGSVFGLTGSGRSILLGFLAHRPGALQSYLPDQAIAIIPVDIYSLPANDLSSFYRTILHAFYWVRDRVSADIQETIANLYVAISIQPERLRST